jgi:hypothetical protein
MPNSEHVYEQDFEVCQTEFVRTGQDPAPEIHLSELKRCVESLSKSDDGPRKRTALSTKQASHAVGEKRSEPRFLTRTPALLQILNPFSDQCWHIYVLDVSKNGLGLYMPVAPMPGSAVKVRMKDCVAFGNTRYSVRTAEGYLVGVQLDHVLGYTALARICAEGVPEEREIV